MIFLHNAAASLTTKIMTLTDVPVLGNTGYVYYTVTHNMNSQNVHMSVVTEEGYSLPTYNVNPDSGTRGIQAGPAEDANALGLYIYRWVSTVQDMNIILTKTD